MKPTPEHIEPVAWVREGSIEELHKDGMHSGVTTALWLDESTEGKRHPKRIPLYDATAIAAAEERARMEERARVDQERGYIEDANGNKGWIVP